MEPAPNTVALLRFDGESSSPPSVQMRGAIKDALEEQGWQVRPVALDLTAAAAKVSCDGEIDAPECLQRVGQWLNASSKTAAEYVVVGIAQEGALQIFVYATPRASIVAQHEAVLRAEDLILPVVLPQAVVRTLNEARQPPPPATPEELAILAALEEPVQTPEELAAERKAIEAAQAKAEADRVAAEPSVVGDVEVTVDLKDDFAAFCRQGPRTPRTSRDDPKDLRPSCKRGPFWGYWQPRGFVALGLTAAAAVVTLGFYSAALAARRPYNEASDDVDAYLDAVNGDPTQDPHATVLGDQRYDELAVEVTRSSGKMQRLALTGDIMLGVTALVGGVLAVIIVQDRREAKAFIRQEKQVRAISTLRVLPWAGRGTYGSGLSFAF